LSVEKRGQKSGQSISRDKPGHDMPNTPEPALLLGWPASVGLVGVFLLMMAKPW
jgi:hypothetical protein